MRQKRVLALVILTGLLQGCLATTAGYEKVLDTWKGADVEDLILAWGPPQSQSTLSDGSVVLQYTTSRSVTKGGTPYSAPVTVYHQGSIYGDGSIYDVSGTSTGYVTQLTPKHTVQMKCVTRFFATPKGRILTWSHEGNDCKRIPPQ